MKLTFFVLIAGVIQTFMFSNIQKLKSSNEDCSGKLVFRPDLLSYPEVNKSLMIKDAKIMNDQIHLRIEHTGSCSDKTPLLVSDGAWMESYPVQLFFFIEIQNQDPCDKVVEEDICFDIKEISETYKKTYREGRGRIIINLQQYDKRLYYDF